MTAIHLQDDAWEDIEEGTEALLDEWHVKEGDVVEAGQLVASVMVIKTSFDVLAPAAGTIGKLLVAAQDNFTRGQALAELN
ncbi:lipoyl domain-containing protein [Pseudomonas sp. SA3-5]|uniref:Lipoyl domain-containing protein n=1 Tax=Pseudomonas aestuarii TaxID=3018340 RepID=A0ABT4XK61_9PSED|nr:MULTISPECIES: lipoyl domain-containing protein [Pseudomonas]MCG4453250.1 lipoyl domain-containing protein [Pseudomonas sp. MMS21 TM103]MDA7088616.1 lipoyl domain-containing protein [Pseudomonas aestuarii]